MQTIPLRYVIGGLIGHQGIVLALGAALTVVWLVAALVTAIRRKAK
ncbi:MAG TPA: hypothetical protein VHR41_18415 [Gemmatimonadales bacterium]|jgi:hypothetical protein|nr:hypothetical protein [Gemmatimonadales bacterium]